MKEYFLKILYKAFPFNLQGDLEIKKNENNNAYLSCLIICGGRRPDDLRFLLEDLSRQTLENKRFEIVILVDGVTAVVKNIIRDFETKLTIIKIENKSSNNFLGHLRNVTIEKSHGKYLLFLNDDTRILQADFLEKALTLLKEHNPDVIMPRGFVSFCILKGRIHDLDQYSFATRCCLYQRSALEHVSGFNDNMTAFEDHEMAIRLLISGIKIIKTDQLTYYHPPLYIPSMDKPYTFGQSIMRLKKFYSFPVWLIVYLNTLRFLFYIFIPTQHNLQWFRLSLGVLVSPFKKDFYHY